MRNFMRLQDARLCPQLDCSTVYDGQTCPRCGSAAGMPLQKFVDRTSPERIAASRELERLSEPRTPVSGPRKRLP